MRLQSILVLLINSHDLFRNFSRRVRAPSEGRDDTPIVHCRGEARLHCRLTGESSRISALDPTLTFTESGWDVWPGPAATTAASIRSNVPLRPAAAATAAGLRFAIRMAESTERPVSAHEYVQPVGDSGLSRQVYLAAKHQLLCPNPARRLVREIRHPRRVNLGLLL